MPAIPVLSKIAFAGDAKPTDVPDPTSDQDASTKKYADIYNGLTLPAAQTSVTPREILIEAFDPGAQDPLRWNSALDAAVAYANTNGVITVIFKGAYTFDKKVVVTSRINLRGDVGNSLTWMSIGDAGIEVTIDASRSRFAELNMIGPDPWTGADTGLLLNGALCQITNLSLTYWSAAGVAIKGNVPGSNANGILGINCTFNLCGHGGAPAGTPDVYGAGIICNGGDSNGGMFLGCSFFDCRKGCYDSSFLGNAWIGCSAEGCNNRFDVPLSNPIDYCGFKTDDPNTRSTFVGCYTEGDSVGQVVYPSTIFGGFFGNTGGAVQINSIGGVESLSAAHRFIDPIAPPGPDPAYPNRQILATIGGSLPGEAFSLYVSDAQTGANVYLPQAMRYNHWTHPTWWGWNWASLDFSDAYRFKGGQFWVPNDLMLGLNGSDHGVRFAMVTSLAEALANTPSDSGAWRVGDRLLIKFPTPGNPSSYVCTDAGPPAVFNVENTLAP